MSKISWKPGTMLYPVPVVMVTCKHGKKDNIITIAWIGTVCSDPPMISISIRPERYSYHIIRESGVFAVNVPDNKLVYAVDFCGVRSGREIDKFFALNLTREKAYIIDVPLIKESPLSLECKIKDVIELGSHHMFIANIVAVDVDESLIDKKGKFHIDRANLLCYNHGKYCTASKPFGKFGFSVEKKEKRRGKN